MPLVKVKPTSPGRRALVKVVNPELHKGEPVASLTRPQKRGSGRNNHGRITVRHQGGGHKHHLRIIDWRRNKDGIAAKVERLEYDPNRSAHLALLLYADGERRYVLAPKGVTVGAQLMSRRRSADQAGQRAAAAQHPGRYRSALRRDAARQGRAARALRRCARSGAGARRLVCAASPALGRDPQGAYRLPRDDRRSRQFRAQPRVDRQGRRVRWRGVRPTVRGVAMNPIDHPHGGGEGRTAAAQPPVSPWGVQTKGFKTRNNKRTQVMIVRDRRVK